MIADKRSLNIQMSQANIGQQYISIMKRSELRSTAENAEFSRLTDYRPRDHLS
jgi:hypothetical protein